MVDQVVKGVIGGLGLHVSVEESGHRGLTGCSAIVHDVPPSDSHHGLDAEPEPVKIRGYDSLDLTAMGVIAGSRDRDFAEVDRFSGLAETLRPFPHLFRSDRLSGHSNSYRPDGKSCLEAFTCRIILQHFNLNSSK